MREKLRALCTPNFTKSSTLTYQYQRWERHRVPDGRETYRDSKGKTKTRFKSATVNVLMSYTKGKLSIEKNYDLDMQSGFDLSIKLTDGKGVAVAPSTGQRHNITNTVTLSREDLGIDNQYENP